jgi:prolyl 4-hydroxylase
LAVVSPWPLEVIGHDGKAHNVTMLPGDMVLYESHSIIHGRQFPLKGRFMANLFIHFEPIGPIGGQVVVNGDLPPYLIPGSESEPDWREENPRGHKLMGPSGGFATGSTELHHHSLSGDYEKAKLSLDQHEDLINVRDENGWSALHEAVRSGATDIVKLLIERGAEMNARTGKRGSGESALAMAKKYLGQNHAITKHLQEMGAMELRYNGSEL